MTTTIQVDEKTLKVLKKIKYETKSSSYDEAINKLVEHQITGTLAGFLGKRPIKELMKDLRDKNERF